MIPTMSIKRTASLWGISERRVNELCRTGRIEGAIKEDGRWQIPVNSKKPFDGRYTLSMPPSLLRTGRMPLPVGISDYKKVSRDYYYVDKTLMIKDILDEKAKISLFTRPRSFGKSLNMDMLKTFFEMSDGTEDTSLYFRDKKIWQSGEEYRCYQGKYPVIFLDFRGISYKTWEETYARIEKVIRDEYDRHRDILESDRCSEQEKVLFSDMLMGRATREETEESLGTLIKVLYQHFGIEPMVIVDEYDTPLSAGYCHGYYEDVKRFIDVFLVDALNESRHLSYAFLAGILNLIHHGIRVNSVLSRRYAEYFGFTEDEVRDMLEDFESGTKQSELRNWYASYHVGETDVYSPWSIINYFNDDCRPLPYWEMTGSNDVINSFLSGASLDMLDRLELMMQSKAFPTRVELDVAGPESKEDPCALYSYMIFTGFLKAVKSEMQFDGDYMCDITIPNREIAFIYGKKILKEFESIIPNATAIAVRESIYRGDTEELRSHIQDLILHTSSFNKQGNNRIFYHGLVLGLCAMLGSRYYVVAEQEQDTGNFSVEMMPLEVRLPGILIQTKRAQIDTSQQLDALATFAVKQITNRQYETEAKARYVDQALKYGVAYSGTAVKIVRG